MVRNSGSKRSQKWFARNNLDNDICREYVDKLCEIYFGFKDYSFAFFNGNYLSLYVNYGLKSYIICVDEYEIKLKLLEENSNSQNKNKYHELKSFFGDNCWFECLYWIKHRGI